jgi:alpha-L-fucosidase
MSRYGRIDMLWYDLPWPLQSPERWESRRLNAMARSLQPHLLINNRSQLPEDFGTPEEHIKAADPGRAWESCMTFNGAWGWQQTPAEDWYGVRKVLELLRTCAAGQGNLLLNVGPKPDGTVPNEAVERLGSVGRWLTRNGEAVYGRVNRADRPTMEWMANGGWTTKGRTAYFWCTRWPGRDLVIGGLRTRVREASLLAGGKPIRFEQEGERLVLRGLPASAPDTIAGVTVIRLECSGRPRQRLGTGCVWRQNVKAKQAGSNY